MIPTHLLVPLLLPLRNQIAVRIAVLQQPVIQLLADGFLLIVEIIDISRAYSILPSQRPLLSNILS